MNKLDLALKCKQEIKDLNLKVEISNNDFLMISPPKQIPFELNMDIVKCNKELIKLYKNEK